VKLKRKGKDLAYLHVHKVSGFFGAPVFIQPIRQIKKLSNSSDWQEKPAIQTSYFIFGHVNRLIKKISCLKVLKMHIQK